MQTNSEKQFQDKEVIILACFISRLITTESLNADEVILDTVITSLTDMTGPLSLRDHAEREQALLDLLTTEKIKHLDQNQLLATAIEAKCFKIAKHLLETKKDYAKILNCFLKDRNSSPELFNYIKKHIDAPERHIRQQFTEHFAEICEIDCKKTADIVLEHFPEQLGTLSRSLRPNPTLHFDFLTQIVELDLKVPRDVAEEYLGLLCARDSDPRLVQRFVQMGACGAERALEITLENDQYLAAAHLLEAMGDWIGALELLLGKEAIDDAMNVCVRGAEHLDNAGAQDLWLMLLKHPLSTKPLRQLLHAAAPHVPPAQLIELVSDARLGDLKGLVQGMLADYSHDELVLQTTTRILGKDLHQGGFLLLS